MGAEKRGCESTDRVRSVDHFFSAKRAEVISAEWSG
jgi:hypothetical protein